MSFLLRVHFVVFAILIIVGWFWPRLGNSWADVVQRLGEKIARRQSLAILFVFTAVLLVRSSLLPLMPIPKPGVHDEFSYLLAGDTFAHGRIANPPHPMWLFFDTFHVLQHPTYASMYPPAQGAFLAIGELAGNPWMGVLLSDALMCAAILWAMQGWMPSSWAFLGGLLASLRIGLVSDWINSYWGGAAAAIGGALVIGALPRIYRFRSFRDTLPMAVGIWLLANSRPLEGFIFCLPVAVALAIWSFSAPDRQAKLHRVLLPLAGGCLCLLAFVGYYNWRVTENPLLLPEVLDARTYTGFSLAPGTAGPAQQQVAKLRYSNPQFESFYNGILRPSSVKTFWEGLRMKVHRIWLFFFGTTLLIPLIAFRRTLEDKGTRFCAIQLLFCFATAIAVPVAWYFPHYFAPATATIFIIIAQCLRQLWSWTLLGKPAGIYLTRLVVVLTLLRPMVIITYAHQRSGSDWRSARADMIERLNRAPGKQLALVCYKARHNPDHEWVYNSADIDGSKIVWARVIPGQDLSPLLEFYKQRQVWLLDADSSPPDLETYSGQACPLDSVSSARN